MAVIFYFSSRTADNSAKQSGGILEFLIKLFGDNFFTDFIVRKSAHFLEFTGLCLLLSAAYYYTRDKLSPVLSVMTSALWAVTDEVHQIFVEGRSCELRDWFIDLAGSLLGAFAFWIIYVIIRRLKAKDKKRNNK